MRRQRTVVRTILLEQPARYRAHKPIRMSAERPANQEWGIRRAQNGESDEEAHLRHSEGEGLEAEYDVVRVKSHEMAT